MSEAPHFIDDTYDAVPVAVPVRPVAPRGAALPLPVSEERPQGRLRSYIATLDKPLVVVVGILLAIGMMMVYSTTFFWSFVDFGSETAILVRQVQFVGIGLVIATVLSLIDYRVIRHFAVWIILLAISLLVAVLLFGDRTFGATRSLIGGSLQPGEFAELAMVVYLAAWMSSKRTKIQSVFYGLIPFATLIGIVGLLVMLQPDLSTAAVIFATSGIMFFLAGASILQIGLAAAVAAVLGIIMIQVFPYASERVADFSSGITDLTQTDYHTLQVLIAFQNGGWTGRGIGESLQKFQALPAPHTDSIFAVIGEELGLLGAGFVVLLFIAFVMRSFMIANRVRDPFGALLASGIAIWVAVKALLNIAVMANVVPSSGLSLPFISYGGSALLMVMTGVGLLLSVGRISRQAVPDRRGSSAGYDRGWGHRGARVSGAGSRRSAERSSPRR